MKRKDKVRVFGRTITIRYIKNLKLGDVRCWGLCDAEKLEISIESSASDEMYKRILKHEIMHMKLRLSGVVELISPELEETLATLAEFD